MTKRASASEAPSGPTHDAADDGLNEVRLCGRLSGAPVERELPSGDTFVQFRVVVARPPARGVGARRGQSIDTIDCAAWRKDVQRTLLSCAAGDIVEVTGALRRRFWRTPGGPASKSEVEVVRLRRRPRG